MCVGACVSMCMRRQIDAIFLLRSFSIMDLRQGLSVDLQLIEYARLDGQGSLYPCLLSVGITGEHSAFYMGSGDPNSSSHAYSASTTIGFL